MLGQAELIYNQKNWKSISASLKSKKIQGTFTKLSSTIRNLHLDTWEWVRIDCGADRSYEDANGDTWNTDEDYIKTGSNERVPQNSSSKVEQLNTLRVFKEQNKNSYTLPTPTSTRYLVRAMFLYGNYDGLSKPPIFDLEFDGNKWATVVTNMTDSTYYEMIYATKGESISVCLTRTQDQQFPFISRLESLPLPVDMYAQMRRDMAWFKSYRYNYGANDQILGYPDDKYNRIWKPLIPSGLEPVTANFTSLDVTSVDVPPDSAIIQAVQAPTSTDTIDLIFTFGNVSHLHHVEMYFTEPFLNASATRSFNVIVNNDIINTTSPEYQNCLSVGANSLSVGTLVVQLVPTDDSTLPPIISAIEVYTVSNDSSGNVPVPPSNVPVPPGNVPKTMEDKKRQNTWNIVVSFVILVGVVLVVVCYVRKYRARRQRITEPIVDNTPATPSSHQQLFTVTEVETVEVHRVNMRRY
ncbi:hypothetical protein REPUB_Repub05bG0185700 [Reevesia pubescens]